jgi:DNA repair protein RecN (Recombination protein N)
MTVLEELHVRDLALIEEVWLEFGPGMTALTGETGAGKTALLGALKLLLGDRADSGAVRSGSPEALVEGRFLAENTEIIARRRVSADGRSKCTLDGEMATVTALGERLGPLVDLHGQHEHQALLSSASHVGYLDRWAGQPAASALDAYRSARIAYRGAVAALDALAARVADAARNADYLRFAAEEIGRVDPQQDEDTQLESRLPSLQHAERLSEAADDASRLLRGDDGALDRIAEAASSLAKVSGIDPELDALAERLADASAIADDAGRELRGYRDRVDHDPLALDAVMTRLSELGGLTRKYGPRLEDVLRTRDEALSTLEASEAGEGGLIQAKAQVAEARTDVERRAEALAEVRRTAVPGFTEALGTAVGDLAMEGASFEISFSDLPFDSWTADGPHKVEFLYSAAPSQPARPLSRIASGGELSRVMLALKGVLGEVDTVGTLVFDEVDAGIGGATAHAVGRRLADLARTHQVIVVTHLAQVAAYANAQLVVSKTVDDGRASTSVMRVEGDARAAEIARMLSGNDSDASLTHARELLLDAASA